MRGVQSGFGPGSRLAAGAWREAENVEVLGIFGEYVGRALRETRGSPAVIPGRTALDNVRPTETAPIGVAIHAVR